MEPLVRLADRLRPAIGQPRRSWSWIFGIVLVAYAGFVTVRYADAVTTISERDEYIRKLKAHRAASPDQRRPVRVTAPTPTGASK